MENKNFVDYHKGQELEIEIAHINGKDEFPYDVLVYGCTIYGIGENEFTIPHFHFTNNINKPDKFKLTIKIENIDNWNINKDVKLLGDSNWDNLDYEKQNLIDWLDKPNFYFDKLTNYDVIRVQWNMLNRDNPNVNKVETITTRKYQYKSYVPLLPFKLGGHWYLWKRIKLTFLISDDDIYVPIETELGN
jgi:hypothetical protein